MSSTYIDIHVLQTYPASNLNRDDLGSPKTVTIGGTTRTRVSSQCLKRATRLEMESHLSSEDPLRTLRTHHLPRRVARVLTDSYGWDPATAAAATEEFFGDFISAAGPDSSGEGAPDADRIRVTNVLMFLANEQIVQFAELLTPHLDWATARATSSGTVKGKKSGADKDGIFAQDKSLKKERDAILSARTGVVPLLGRFLAEIPSARVDAAVQVAHAFTTHTASAEVDYLTAVDDVNEAEDISGAGHLTLNEFSSGVFYRYATVDVGELRRNLATADPSDPGAIDQATEELTNSFITGFINAVPSGKRTSTAPNTRPDLVVIQVRHRPLSLASAFNQPVKADREGGHIAPSQAVISAYARSVGEAFGDEDVVWTGYTAVTGDGEALGVFGERQPVRELIAAAVSAAL
jgi:CRISPR system Cascade subunit CasC